MNKEKMEKQKATTSELAIWPLWFALVFFLAAIVLILNPNWLSIIICLISVPLGIIFSIIAIKKIKSSQQQLKGLRLAVTGLIIHLILAIVIVCAALSLKLELDRILCQERLYGLRQYLMLYCEDNNEQYPLAEKWCDLLKEDKCPELYFICTKSKTKKGKCDFAMDPDCEPNSSPDVVLLFESKAGWNQHGGPELINFDNHKTKCNILLNDWRVKHITPEEVNDLKWK